MPGGFMHGARCYGMLDGMLDGLPAGRDRARPLPFYA